MVARRPISELQHCNFTNPQHRSPIFSNKTPSQATQTEQLIHSYFPVKNNQSEISKLHTLPKTTGVYPLKAKLRRNHTDPSSLFEPETPRTAENACRHHT
jgi:hypothetical protein